MAPRVAPRRERDNDFSAVGKIGRRTGVTLPQGRLDENGIEEISGMFSSPRKPSPLRKSVNALGMVAESSMSEESTAMVGINSSGLTPRQALSTRKSLREPSLPPPRSASPRKAGISGHARRSNGIDLLSTRDKSQLDSDERDNTPLVTPTNAGLATIRRFSPSPEKTPLRDITPTSRPMNSSTTKLTSRARLTNPSDALERMISSKQDEPDIHEQAVDEIEEAANVAPRFDSERRGFSGGADSGHLSSHENEDESELSDDFRVPAQAYDDEDGDQTFEPPTEIPAKTQGPAKANSRRKRKSDAIDREVEGIGHSSPTTKRARTTADIQEVEVEPATRSSATLRVDPEVQSVPIDSTEPNRRQPVKRGKKTVEPLSAQQGKELDHIIAKVKSRPGHSNSLYILRRETPADDAVTHTRSGRVSVKPLAYWRNERCVYGGSPRSSDLQAGARFPLNSIKEIIRTEEVVSSAKASKKKKKGRKSRQRQGGDNEGVLSDSDEHTDGNGEDPNAEPWESEVGIFRGSVSVWDGQQQAPLEDEEVVDLAYTPASIQTREVKGSTFRYAKLVSTNFFGTGIVDLPPGGIKKPKNSKKMQMSFFVAKGRVTVQVGPLGGKESQFSIGKGGFWQVPRGNQYSIRNEMEKPARIFFSQGCETGLEDDE